MDENNKNNDVQTGNNEREYFAAEEPQATSFGIVQRVLSVFIAPVKLMENIAENPKILIPLLVIALLMIPSAFFTIEVTALSREFMDNFIFERHGLRPSEIEGAVVMGTGATIATGLIFGTIMILIAGIIEAFFAWLFCKIVGGKGRFKQYFSMMMHANIVLISVGIISLILMGHFGVLTDFLSLAAVLMPRGDMSSFAFNVLNVTTVGAIWGAVLVFLGIRVFNGFSAGKAGVITGILLFFGILAAAALAYGSLAMADWSIGQMAGM